MEKRVKPLEILGADHVAIRVPDLDASVRWYEEKLGFRELLRWEARSYVELRVETPYLKRGDVVLEVIGGAAPDRLTPAPTTIREEISFVGYSHLCLRVADLDAAIDLLRLQGVDVFAGPNVNPEIRRKTAHFLDNDGIPIELVQYL
jgi:catechol 2,3-dioxygenase-like lactoylglutathione lyase family enzyme